MMKQISALLYRIWNEPGSIYGQQEQERTILGQRNIHVSQQHIGY
jgi:hypothetical protein